jgi:hypothetical protein
VDFWRAEVNAICTAHGLEGAEISATFPGTHAVFGVNDDTVLKLLCPVRYNSYHKELDLHTGVLAGNDRFPAIRFHGTSPRGYDYIAFAKLPGKPVREIGRAGITAAAVGSLAQTVCAMQAATLGRRLERVDDEHPSPTNCLVHYDLTEDHVYVDDQGEFAGIIDFGDARMGHPSEELPVLFIGCFDCDDSPIALFEDAYHAASAHYQIEEADVVVAIQGHTYCPDMIAHLERRDTAFARRMLAAVADRRAQGEDYR